MVVVFSMDRPGRPFVKVHLTVSPTSTLKVAVAVAVLPVELLSSQTMLVRIQPAGTDSVLVYWPAARLLTTIC